MKLSKSILAGFGLVLTMGIAGCGAIGHHVDCDQVSQAQRSGQSDTEIAQASGFSVDQVQSCSQTGSSSGRETANNYQDQPRLPAMIPNIPSSAIHP